MKFSSALASSYHVVLLFLTALTSCQHGAQAREHLSVLNGGYDYLVHHVHQPDPLVVELRQKIQGLPLNPLLTTDRQLARHLEESYDSVPLVLERLRRTTKFRKAIHADELLSWTPAHFIEKNFPIEQSGFTDDGCPVYLIPFGRWNFQEFFKHGGDVSDLFFYAMRFMEEANNNTIGLKNLRTGWPVDQVVLLIDAKGYSSLDFLRLRVTKTLIRIFRAINRHYPFTIKKAIVVNAPVALKAFWKVSRVVSTARSRSVYKVFSGYGRRARNLVFWTIPSYSVPVELGGTYVANYNSIYENELEYFEYKEHIEPVQNIQNFKHELHAQKAQAVQVVQSVELVQPVQAIQPTPVLQPVQQLQPLHTVQAVHTIQPVEPIHSIQIAHQAHHVQLAQHLQLSDHAQQVQLIHEAQHVEHVVAKRNTTETSTARSVTSSVSSSTSEVTAKH